MHLVLGKEQQVLNSISNLSKFEFCPFVHLIGVVEGRPSSSSFSVRCWHNASNDIAWRPFPTYHKKSFFRSLDEVSGRPEQKFTIWVSLGQRSRDVSRTIRRIEFELESPSLRCALHTRGRGVKSLCMLYIVPCFP